MSYASATSPISKTTGPPPVPLAAAAPKALETVPSIPLAPRLHNTRGGSGRAGQKVSMSRTGIEEATNSVASSGNRTPSSAATTGSLSGPAASTPRIASAARSSALRQPASQSGSALGASSAASVAAGSSASTRHSVDVGSCQRSSGSSTTCGTSSMLASQARKGLDVGRSPTRSTRSGPRRPQTRGRAAARRSGPPPPRLGARRTADRPAAASPSSRRTRPRPRPSGVSRSWRPATTTPAAAGGDGHGQRPCVLGRQLARRGAGHERTAVGASTAGHRHGLLAHQRLT